MKLTILMYHKIDEHAGVGNPGNYVSPANFAAQIDALQAWGYRTIEFEQWLDARAGRGKRLPDKPLIVTFDDGYTCFDRNAWPVLRARGMGATVFLVAGQIGGTTAWEAAEPQETLLGATRIRALQADGARFGSHSVSHRPMARIPAADALDELTRSRGQLSALLDRDVDVFAYPFSNQSAAVRDLARQAGYRAAVRGKGRMNSPRTDPLGLRRIKVEPTTTIDALEKTLFIERYLRLF
ncbi:MAG: polysaccharide deacetylase family protein [Gemmatimonadaceae bacterium]